MIVFFRKMWNISIKLKILLKDNMSTHPQHHVLLLPQLPPRCFNLARLLQHHLHKEKTAPPTPPLSQTMLQPQLNIANV